MTLAAALLLGGAGCASRRVPTVSQEQRFWRDCQETVPAVADGFQHFMCVDKNGKRWEILVRREPK